MTVLGLKVEASRPEDAPERLAVRLAEALSNVQRLIADREAFSLQASAERKKAADLRFVVGKVREYRKDPPEKARRMEPYAEYDLDSCREELEEYERRAEELQGRADECQKEVDHWNREATTLQGRLNRSKFSDGVPN